MVAGLAAAAYAFAGPVLARWPARWLEFGLGAHLVAFYLAVRHSDPLRGNTRGLRPGLRSEGVVIGATFLGLVAVLTFSATTSPLVIPPDSRIAIEREALQFPTITERDVRFPYNPNDPERMGRHPTVRVGQTVSMPPPSELIRWAGLHLPLDSVFAVNLLNRYSPAPFMPQQIAYWPHIDGSTGSYFRRIFPAYYELLEASLSRIGEQPFFNLEDSLDERVAFLNSVGATHVLVDPMYHDSLSPLLSSWPGTFRRQYDAGGWAVFEWLGRPHPPQG